jgi:opacity protein-like surface antigen
MAGAKDSVGISKGMFIAGIIVAVLASSAISSAVSMQWAKGPKGDTGDTGPTGPQGPIGPKGEAYDARLVRFYNPNETMVNSEDYKVASTFLWIPKNATNNAVLAVHCYFKFRSSPTSYNIGWNLKVNESYAFTGSSVSGDTAYKQTTIFTTDPQSFTLMPNQNAYTITFAFASPSAIAGELYVKDINVLLEVIDGLPPEN